MQEPIIFKMVNFTQIKVLKPEGLNEREKKAKPGMVPSQAILHLFKLTAG